MIKTGFFFLGIFRIINKYTTCKIGIHPYRNVCTVNKSGSLANAYRVCDCCAKQQQLVKKEPLKWVWVNSDNLKKVNVRDDRHADANAKKRFSSHLRNGKLKRSKGK